MALGDHLVRRKSPDATMEELARAVDRYAGRHGAKRLRHALTFVRPRTDSVKETELRLLVALAGIPEPVVNAPLYDSRGTFVKHGDLVFVREKVLLEYDGEQHRTDSDQYAKDAADFERLTLAGWLILRVRKQELKHPALIVARVRRALSARAVHANFEPL